MAVQRRQCLECRCPAGATIRVPLDKSEFALDRLEKCVAKNNRAVQDNPFVAPAHQP